VPSPIGPEKTKQVQKLLAQGVIQERVATQTGVSITTVRRVAARLRTAPDHAEAGFDNWVRTRARRCGGCGARVYIWPCLHCQLEAERDGRPKSRK
jgi:hypothetical protein